MKILRRFSGVSLVLLALSLLDSTQANAQLFGNWSVPWFGAWVNSFMNASSMQSCPTMTSAKTLTLGKVAEVGVNRIGTSDVYVLRSPYGRVDADTLNRAMKVQFQYKIPCQSCSEQDLNTSERNLAYAMVAESAFNLGKALFLRVAEGSPASWDSQDVNEECVYTIQGVEGSAFGLPSEIRVE